MLPLLVRCRLPQLPSCSTRPFAVLQRAPSTSTNGCERFYSSTSTSTRTGTNGQQQDGRPHMFQLEHIKKRLEYTTPLMFRSHMDYTFYRKDIVLEDRIFNFKKTGVDQLRYHLGFISVTCQFTFPQITMEALSIMPIMEDGSVRLRWRIHYLTAFQFLNPWNFNADHRKKNLKWYDGYSIFYVDAEGLVFKMTIQKMMPDNERLAGAAKSNTKRIAEKIFNPSPVNASAATAVTGTAVTGTATTTRFARPDKDADADAVAGGKDVKSP